MKDRYLVFAALLSRRLSSALCILLTALGVGLAIFLMQFGSHIQDRLSRDAQGIDIVVGAKGSPLQLVLSSVYHADIPTGNMPYDEAQRWMKHPHVKAAIPVALGDNWKGYRIVGTSPSYIDHYNAKLASGRIWNMPFEAVAGASTGLDLGQKFMGAHGLGADADGHVHEHDSYQVVGVLEPTNTVLDRLILTSLDSVLLIHGLEGVETEKSEAHAGHAHNHHAHDGHHHGHYHDKKEAGAPEITALLLSVKTPLATVNLPRTINKESGLQAASPSYEIMRLTSIMGIGSRTFMILSFILIAIAALSIFSGVAGSLDGRLNDLAVMRAIGYRRARIFKIVAMEGMILVFSGLALGFLAGTIGFIIARKTILSSAGNLFDIPLTGGMGWLALAVLISGLAASALPAWRAGRIDAAKLLSNRV